MVGELLEKAKIIFDGVFSIWPMPAHSWTSSADEFRNQVGEYADSAHGAADRSKAAGAVGQVVVGVNTDSAFAVLSTDTAQGA
jgi:hypothetical protein